MRDREQLHKYLPWMLIIFEWCGLTGALEQTLLLQIKNCSTQQWTHFVCTVLHSGAFWSRIFHIFFSASPCLKFSLSLPIPFSVKRLFITSKFPENLFSILLKSFNEPTTMLWFVSFDFFNHSLWTSIVSLRKMAPDAHRPPVWKCYLFEHWTEVVDDDF